MTTRKAAGGTVTADATFEVDAGETIKGPTIHKDPHTPKNLIQKLCEVIAEIGPIKPDGWNDFHRYKYFSDEQLSSLFRDKLAKRNVLLVPSVRTIDIRDFTTEKGKHSFLTTLLVDWTIFDGDGHESIQATTAGQGDDPGDKGSNKAMTGAFKYLLIKMAQIGGEGDAEADEATDQRHSPQDGPGGPQSRPTRRSSGPTPAAVVSTPAAPVEGVKKGGRQAGANETQVDTVSRLAGELGIGFDGLINVIRNVLSVELELPEETSGEDRKKFMRSFFENLTAEEIGKVIAALQEAKERTPQEASA